METGGWIVASPNEWKKQKTNPSQNGNQRQIGLIALHLDLAGLTTPSSTKILVCHVKPTQVLVLASEEAIIIPSESWMCRSGEKGNKSACKTKSETKPQALLCSCWHDLPTLVPQVARTAQYKLWLNKWAIAPRKNIWATWACWSLGYQSFSHVPIDLSGQQLPEARGLVPGLQGAQHTRPAARSREMATAGGWDGTEQTWRISPSLHHWDLHGTTEITTVTVWRTVSKLGRRSPPRDTNTPTECHWGIMDGAGEVKMRPKRWRFPWHPKKLKGQISSSKYPWASQPHLTSP